MIEMQPPQTTHNDRNTGVIPNDPISYQIAFRKIIGLSTPYALALFISISGDFAIRGILSQVGQDRLAAGGLVGPVQSILLGSLTSMLAGVCISAGNEKGGSDPTNVGKFYRQGLLLAGLLSLPLMALAGFAVARSAGGFTPTQ